MRWHKVTAGEWASNNGAFRAVKDWGDAPGWTLLLVDDGDVEVLDTLPLLRDCKSEAIHIERRAVML